MIITKILGSVLELIALLTTLKVPLSR